MDDSPPVLLPAELRNQIYHYALSRPGPLQITAPSPASRHTAASPIVKGNQQTGITALQRTCRQLQRETTQMLYCVNDFLIPFRRFERWDEILQWFLTRIGRANALAIRRITVEVELSLRTVRRWETLVLEPLRRPSAAKELNLRDLQLLISFRYGKPHAVGPVMTLDIGRLEADWTALLELFEVRLQPYNPSVCNHLALLNMMIWLQRCRLHGYWEFPWMAASLAGVGSRGYALVGWRRNGQVALLIGGDGVRGESPVLCSARAV